MYCKKCGFEMSDNSVFCGKCGTKTEGKDSGQKPGGKLEAGVQGVQFLIALILIVVGVLAIIPTCS